MSEISFQLLERFHALAFVVRGSSFRGKVEIKNTGCCNPGIKMTFTDEDENELCTISWHQSEDGQTKSSDQCTDQTMGQMQEFASSIRNALTVRTDVSRTCWHGKITIDTLAEKRKIIFFGVDRQIYHTLTV